MNKLIKMAFSLAALFFAVAGFSQEKPKSQENPKEEGSKEIELNSEGQERDHSPEIYSGNEEGEGSGSSAVGARKEEESTDASSPVGPKTTSPSGSPGVIQDEHQPDGTNTVPSAKPNIAGAKVPGSRVVPPRQKPTDKAKAGSTTGVGNNKPKK
jgi:hypothetical protein